MSHRTTFALDEATIGRLKRLADLWSVSQAEVVRRSVAMAERQARQEELDLPARLEAWYGKGGLDAERARLWLDEVAQGREEWGR